MLTVSWIFQDDHDANVDTLEHLRDVAQALHNKFFLAWYHCGRAYAAYRHGDLNVLREHGEASLRYCAEVGDPVTDGIAIAILAAGEALAGEYETATERLQSLLRVAEARGGSVAVPQALFMLATLLVGCGDAETARAYLEPLLKEAREFHMVVYEAWALCIIGASELASDRVAEGRSAFEQARTAPPASANPW